MINLQADSPVLGFLKAGTGHIAVYGDSNCLDSSHMVTNCFWLLKKMLDYTSNRVQDPVLFSKAARLDMPLYEEDSRLPSRRNDVNFSSYSSVLGKELLCKNDSRFEVWGTKGYNIHVRGRNRRLPGHQSIDIGGGLNTSIETPSLKSSVTSDGSKNETVGNYLGFFNYKDEVNHLLIQ